MAKRTKTIVLEESVVLFDKRLTEITIREPTCAEFISIGEPQIWARSADGGIFVVEQPAAIKQYLDRCLMVENGSAAFSLLSLQDGKAIKGALLGFFTEAEATTPSSDVGPSSSST